MEERKKDRRGVGQVRTQRLPSILLTGSGEGNRGDVDAVKTRTAPRRKATMVAKSNLQATPIHAHTPFLLSLRQTAPAEERRKGAGEANGTRPDNKATGKVESQEKERRACSTGIKSSAVPARIE